MRNTKEYMKAYYLRRKDDPEYKARVKKIGKQYYDNLKSEAIANLGGQCKICGDTIAELLVLLPGPIIVRHFGSRATIVHGNQRRTKFITGRTECFAGEGSQSSRCWKIPC